MEGQHPRQSRPPGRWRVTEPGAPGSGGNRPLTALIVITIVVVVFGALVAFFLYGLQGIGR